MKTKNNQNKVKIVGIGILLIAVALFLSFHSNFLSVGYLVSPHYVFMSPYSATSSLFAITGVQASNLSYINQPLKVSATASISTQNQTRQVNNTAVNTQCAGFGYDNTTQLFVYKGLPQTIKTTSYTTSFSYTPLQNGVYAFGAICETARATYSQNTNTWSNWTKQSISSQKVFLVKVETQTTAPVAPSFSFNNFISQILSYISNLFKSLGI